LLSTIAASLSKIANDIRLLGPVAQRVSGNTFAGYAARQLDHAG